MLDDSSQPSWKRLDLPAGAFLLVKRFDVLHEEYALQSEFAPGLYAVPPVQCMVAHPRVRYHGLDRDPLSAWDGEEAPAAEVRLAELEEDGRVFDASIFNADDMVEVWRRAEQEFPGVYEPVWARVAGTKQPPPDGYFRIGYEPTYFPNGSFSPLCDTMCFPRWHGTDASGVAFLEFFCVLNAFGLFRSERDASDFLAYYLSFEWTEAGEWEIAEVWIPDQERGLP